MDSVNGLLLFVANTATFRGRIMHPLQAARTFFVAVAAGLSKILKSFPSKRRT
jgi:hypothetical protein